MCLERATLCTAAPMATFAPRSARASGLASKPTIGRQTAMAKFIDEGLAPPDHPIYKEGPRSYSPHWARGLALSKTPQKKPTAGPTVGKGGSGNPRVSRKAPKA
jgi:hypothetical protein